MLCSSGLVTSFSTIDGEAPEYWLITVTAGNSSEGKSSCLSVGIISAPKIRMAMVASATRLRFARLILDRKDISNSKRIVCGYTSVANAFKKNTGFSGGKNGHHLFPVYLISKREW